jgi:ABC-type uncharacterized transport system substrate-binding protein
MFDLRYYNDITYSNKDPRLIFEDYKTDCKRLFKNPKAAKLTYNDFLLKAKRSKNEEKYKFETSNDIFYILKEFNSTYKNSDLI